MSSTHLQGIVFLSLIAVHSISLPVKALDPGKHLTQYGLDHWGADEGLPQNSVTALAQGPDGFLWIGTLEGVVRYDGFSMELYDRTTVQGLTTNAITALAFDPDGHLWIGTMGGGVGRLDGHRISLLGTAQGLGSDRVWAIYTDRAGTTWVGTAGGLSRLNGGRVTTFATADGLAGNVVRKIIDDAAGGIWIGTDGGLSHLRDQKFANLTTRDGLAHNTVRGLYREDDAGLLVGTLGGGGDEFAVLLPDTELRGATRVAEAIHASVESLRIQADRKPGDQRIGVSIGVAATYPTGKDGYDELIREADRALYRAKNSGRGRVVAGGSAEPNQS